MSREHGPSPSARVRPSFPTRHHVISSRYVSPGTRLQPHALSSPALVLAVVLGVASCVRACTLKTGADCAGSDVNNADVGPVASAEACCAACSSRAGCNAFVWHAPGNDPPLHCYLKTDCDRPAPSVNTTAGVLAGPFPPFSKDPYCNHGHSGPAPTPPTRPLSRVRPPAVNRTFTSPAVESHLDELVNKRTWRDPELATLLWNCLPNTLDTTVWASPSASDPDVLSFVSTGDQASMYLRDSSNQVMPYIRYAKEEPNGIGLFLRGIIRRYVASVMLAPYANSFDFTVEDRRCNPGAWEKDNTTMRDPKTGERVNGMRPGIHQRKWEMDSLAAVLRISRLYYNATEDTSPFDTQWLEAVGVILQTFRAQQQPLTPTNFTSVNYTFQTLTMEPKDTSAHGIGRNHRWTGMIRTQFLPSDDSPRFPYFIPANAMAVVELRATASLLRTLKAGAEADALAVEADALANEVDAGIQQHGIIMHASGSRVYAMEVDGFGNYFFADDANVPSLIALPFFGYVPTSDPVYQSTRRLLLSNLTNPYFYGCGHHNDGCGFLGGIGSEDASGNAGLGRVWALSLCTRLLTVDGDTPEADAERLAILTTLRESSGGTGLMHESYWFEDTSVYTRFWFAMANSYVGEALLNLAETRPHLLFTQ
eukprot:m.185743 g.185743  ORF g.185743 m.185743 type:complete len:651 (+) comp16548_c0_seq1:100-2052(+)